MSLTKRFLKNTTLVQMVCVMSVAAVCRNVLAAGNIEAESEAIVLLFARWTQRILTIFAVIAIMEAGSRFWNEEKSQGARAHMKNVLIGCAICFGAVGICEVLKTSFSGKI